MNITETIPPIKSTLPDTQNNVLVTTNHDQNPPVVVHLVNQIDPTPENLRAAIATAEVWKEGYIALDPNRVFSWQWKLTGESRNPTEFIRALPDSQKPQLPEGYVWLKEGDDLQILRHKNAQALNLTIYLFGPDHKQRFQYLVVDQKSPIHGFAMTKKEGFTTVLRDEFPITQNSFKVGTVTYWRGHIIDYQDTLCTLGSIIEEEISTRFPLNYKPEPDGTWARTLRKEVVKVLREDEGSYSEIMLYGPAPELTKGGTKGGIKGGRAVPEAVFMETFNYGRDRLKGYYVPKNHDCHGWVKAPHEQDFSINKLEQLSVIDTFPALVYENGAALREAANESGVELPSDLEKLDVKDAFHLRRRAEMEFDSAAYMLSYAVYAKSHNATDQVLQFWLGRAADMAAKIDTAYESRRPAYPSSLMNTTKAVYTAPFLDANPELKSLVVRLSVITDKMVRASFHLNSIIAEEEVPHTAAVVPEPATEVTKKVLEEVRCRNFTLGITVFVITLLFIAATSTMRQEKPH